MPKPIDCDPLVYFVANLMGCVKRILGGRATAVEERAARSVGFDSAFDEALAFAQGEQAETLASIIIDRMRYDLEPREWLERFVIPEDIAAEPRPRRKELGQVVRPTRGSIKMILRGAGGDGSEVTITLYLQPKGSH